MLRVNEFSSDIFGEGIAFILVKLLKLKTLLRFLRYPYKAL